MLTKNGRIMYIPVILTAQIDATLHNMTIWSVVIRSWIDLAAMFMLSCRLQPSLSGVYCHFDLFDVFA